MHLAGAYVLAAAKQITTFHLHTKASTPAILSIARQNCPVPWLLELYWHFTAPEIKHH
jgi:hypothetical protein